MIQPYIENANFEDTGFSYTMSRISDKTLSANLKELEQDQLIVRTEYPQIPPKVEYRLSGRGESLMAVLDQLCLWGEEHRLPQPLDPLPEGP